MKTRTRITDLAILLAHAAEKRGISVAEFAATRLDELVIAGPEIDKDVLDLAHRWHMKEIKHDTDWVVKHIFTEKEIPLVFGSFQPLAITKWLGKRGYTAEQAREVLAAQGVTEYSLEELQEQIDLGRKPRARCARLTDEVVKQIEEILR